MIVNVNGKTITVPDGSSISIRDGSVTINGSNFVNYGSETVYVTIEGNCGNIQTVSGDITVKGEVKGDIQTVSGDVECGNVSGRIKSVSGDISFNQKRF